MKRILVRVPQWLGDAVVSTVFLSRLKIRYPEASITVLTPAALSDIFSSHPSVDSIVTIQSHQGPLSVAASVRTQGFDAVFILPRSFRTALEVWLAKIPIRRGYHGDWRGWLLTDPVPFHSDLAYAHRYLRLIDEQALPLSQTKPFFPVQDLQLENRDILEFFSKTPRPILGIGPVSVAPARTWDADRFSSIAKRFVLERGGSVVLFGSAREKSVVAGVKSQWGERVLDTSGRLRLPELGWAIQKCDTLLVNDSGLMHVASCFEKPTTVLFGASDPKWALPPWGHFHAIQHKELSCVPCLKNHCVRVGDGFQECLKKISVEEVWHAISK